MYKYSTYGTSVDGKSVNAFAKCCTNLFFFCRSLGRNQLTASGLPSSLFSKMSSLTSLYVAYSGFTRTLMSTSSFHISHHGDAPIAMSVRRDIPAKPSCARRDTVWRGTRTPWAPRKLWGKRTRGFSNLQRLAYGLAIFPTLTFWPSSVQLWSIVFIYSGLHTHWRHFWP